MNLDGLMNWKCWMRFLMIGKLPMIEHIKEMVEKFLVDEYDPLAFSYDLPDYIVDNYEDICRDNGFLAKKMDDTFTEICAEYENGRNPEPFKQKIQAAYEFVFKND